MVLKYFNQSKQFKRFSQRGEGALSKIIMVCMTLKSVFFVKDILLTTPIHNIYSQNVFLSLPLNTKILKTRFTCLDCHCFIDNAEDGNCLHVLQ